MFRDPDAVVANLNPARVSLDRSAEGNVPLGLRRVRVFHRIRQQVHEDELQAADIHRQCRQVLRDANLDTTGIRHFAKLASGLLGDRGRRHLLHDRAVPAALHAGNDLEFMSELDEVLNVTLDRGERPLGALSIQVRAPQQADSELQRAEELPPFMGGHPRKFLEALVLFRDRLGIEGHECFDRRLRQDVDRLIESRDDRDTVGRRRRQVETLHLLEDERDQHAAQDLIFA